MGFGSSWLEYASSWSKHLKAPLVVTSDGVAGLKWTGRGVQSLSDHADVRLTEEQYSLKSNFKPQISVSVITCNCLMLIETNQIVTVTIDDRDTVICVYYSKKTVDPPVRCPRDRSTIVLLLRST